MSSAVGGGISRAFTAMAAASAMLSRTVRSHFGYMGLDSRADGYRAPRIGRRGYSVAQGKRMARKARNVKRNRRAHK